MTAKCKWLDRNNKFSVKTCKGVEEYLFHQTGIQAQVHKTDRYLLINFSINGELKTVKVDGPFLYCLHEEDFKPLLNQMKA